jgi:TolA-binding protein
MTRRSLIFVLPASSGTILALPYVIQQHTISTMRTFAFIAAIACFGFTAQAQQPTTATAAPVKTAQNPHAEAVRALSGQLKDVLGKVQQMSIANTKQMQGAGAADTERLGKLRTELAGMMNRLEGNLTTVNSSTPENFEAASTEAKSSMTMAEELINKVKAGK